MKWIYGKQDWKTRERGLENCYLMTNGLGGFSSMTMTGAVSRNDHALLMACTTAPNCRYNLIHRLKEELRTEKGEEFTLSTQEFEKQIPEDGYLHLASFSYEDTPVWKFLVNGVEIKKEIGMPQEENTVALRYEIRNRSSQAAEFVLTPFFQFVPKGADLLPEQKIVFTGEAVESEGMTLYLRTNGMVKEIADTEEVYFYRYDVCDGRRAYGHARANHQICLQAEAGKQVVLEVVYEMEPSQKSAESIIEQTKADRKALVERAGFTSEIANMLVKSARQFVSKRESTGGDTILAGYPFFEDWGRDTMIALPGICISTGQFETAKQILRTFAQNERDGLMPNLFPEGGNEPMYNTVDAALLFINCVYLYYEATKDMAFVREVYPVMERIMTGYQKGTQFGIHMDADGLICAGEGLSQVTWMDVRVGEILPTPRHGKPVEINAYWYNALKIMEKFTEEKTLSKAYGTLAEQVKTAFTEQFWMPEKNCLKDLVSGVDADRQIRCNQIWALSMPFTMLEAEKERKIVETVFEKLYTFYGMRTLEEADPQFHPYYGGEMEKRDMAYHQGTVWAFPLGAYYLAYLKVHGHSEQAKQEVKEQLEILESALREGCIGQLPEIYDGKNPVSSKGCFAQAWSVGELLRVYDQIEKK
ncbi:MAG: amylo-alpha-1,6-glucosidase [[Ruminococcus] gnavus]|nr:amylo-alpha-1,6-glucosidase [Mediterraneibacter gnavus]